MPWRTVWQKNIKDEEFWVLLHKVLRQMLPKFAESLGVNCTKFLKRLKKIWIILKQSHWLKHELILELRRLERTRYKTVNKPVLLEMHPE